MTAEQQLHAEYLADQFKQLMVEKYEKGANEHGGNIWEISNEDLLENALEEAIDQVVYLLTLKNKL